MDIVGGRRFVEIPGDRRHELPPLLVRGRSVRNLDKVMALANEIIESEDLIPFAGEGDAAAEDLDRRRMDLAINLVDRYLRFLDQWHWGDGITEWIRQCETTFDSRVELRNLLRPDVWPHAGRSSFVTLLHDKRVEPDGIDVQKAVGLRLTFRQPPPIGCFSNQFLLLLNSTVADTAYQTWAHMMPDPVSSLPPERFAFEVYTM